MERNCEARAKIKTKHLSARALHTDTRTLAYTHRQQCHGVGDIDRMGAWLGSGQKLCETT